MFANHHRHLIAVAIACLLSLTATFAQNKGIRIGSILPNPRGVDQENELLTLVNTLDSHVNMKGWILKDEYNEIPLTGIIQPKGTLTTKLDTGTRYAFLDNKGDTAFLIDPEGNIQDRATYGSSQVRTGEWIVLFELPGAQTPKSVTEKHLLSSTSDFPVYEPRPAKEKGAMSAWVLVLVSLTNAGAFLWVLQSWKKGRNKAIQATRQWIETHSEKITNYSTLIQAESDSIQYIRKNRFVGIAEAIGQDKEFSDIRIDLLPENDPARILVQKIREFVKNHESKRTELNERFTANESRVMSEFFNTVETHPLTEKQRQAVLVNEENNLVIAGAGSGKTSTITARVGYLVQRGLADPSNILVLAFNRAAADELKERIEPLAGSAVNIMTFHKFGLNVIGQSKGRKPNIANAEEDRLGKKLNIHEIINEACGDKSFSEMLLKYFKYYLVPNQDLTSFKDEREYMSYLTNYEMRTLKGEKVKSYGELLIANFLFLNGVTYEYEARYEYNTASPNRRQYKPDFWLPNPGLYIEYLALDRRGNTPSFIDREKYTSELNWKRKTHQEKSTKMIELMCYLTMEGNLEAELNRQLKVNGVEYHPIPPEQALDQINKLGEITKFASLIHSFLSHFKSNNWSFDGLREKAKSHKFSKRSLAFINIFQEVYHRYQNRLKSLEAIDFDDMIGSAVECLESGNLLPEWAHITHILVDEFQDISKGRADLLSALKGHGQEKTLFCVGDDWQAIYRFAGSDVSIMREFEQTFGPSETTALDKTFRYNNQITEFTTDFVLQNPDQIRKDVTALKNVDSPQIFVLTDNETESVLLEQALKHIKNQNSEKKQSVLVLGRYRELRPDGFSSLVRNFSRLHITFMTIHSSKGQQADHVIILGMNSGKYGFPCQRVDDPVMELVLPSTEAYEHAEERRLFYVACTRTKNTVYLINGIANKSHRTSAPPPSKFLREAQNKGLYVRSLTDNYVPHKACPGSCKGIGVLIKRNGRFGSFWSCSLPYCDYKKNIKTN